MTEVLKDGVLQEVFIGGEQNCCSTIHVAIRTIYNTARKHSPVAVRKSHECCSTD